jgi:hypothetical protein
LGDTTFPQLRHLDFHGFPAPGKSSRGFNLALAMSLSASVGWTAFFAQYLQPLPLLFTELKLGVTSLPHLRHLHNQGVDEELYGANGLSPALSITFSATLEFTLFATPLV